MKFIYCFDKELKTKLLQSGFRLLTCHNGLSIFENNTSLKFSFNELDKSQFVFSNKFII